MLLIELRRSNLYAIGTYVVNLLENLCIVILHVRRCTNMCLFSRDWWLDPKVHCALPHFVWFDVWIISNILTLLFLLDHWRIYFRRKWESGVTVILYSLRCFIVSSLSNIDGSQFREKANKALVWAVPKEAKKSMTKQNKDRICSIPPVGHVD